MINYIKLLSLLFLISACNNGKIDNIKENNSEHSFYNKALVEKHLLDNNNSYLELYSNKRNNTLIIQTTNSDIVLDLSGTGNSEYILDKGGSIKIDTISFSDNEKSYVVGSYVKGSTFGAESTFLIYKNTQWMIYKLPFIRAKIYDVDNNGFEDIIEYKSKGDSIVYSFSNGVLNLKY